jgi:hypothetical protein
VLVVDDLPADLLAVLPPGSSDVARQWWNTLSDDDRTRVATLWDERVEVRFFTPQEDDSGEVDEWEQVPQVCGGRFMPSDDAGRAEWEPGYFEHLLQHPELVMAYEPAIRTFHIGCTQHPAARECLADGQVPSGFVCPVAPGQCPMEPLRGAVFSPPLGEGRSVAQRPGGEMLHPTRGDEYSPPGG